MLIPSKVRRRRWAVAVASAVALALCSVATASAAGVVPINPFGTNVVGQQQADGRILLPDNHWISPYGTRAVTFSAQTIGTAISPDGTKIASQTGGDNAGIPQLSISDAATGTVLQTFGGTGVAAPVYSPNGTALYAATSTSVLKYVVGADGKVINPSSPLKIALPSGALPYGLGISADGKTLYAAESGINKLGIIDTATGSVTGQVAVGNAPQGVAVVGNQVFVSNRGGRPAVAGDTTNLSDGTKIVSNPVTGASATGTVSIVDPTVKTPVTALTAPDTSATAPDIIDVDFADGTPAEHAQNLPETTYGAPSIAKNAELGQNVATFNGTTDGYTYPFGDQWSKVAKSFTIECKFRWNGAAVDSNGHGVCEDLNGGGIGVDILNGEPMTYAHIGGAYKEIFDPHPVVSGTWYDVITTWDGSTLREYVNGTQVATMAASGALGLPSPDTSWHWTIGANAAPTPAGIEAPARVSVASSKVWSKALPGGPSVAMTVPTTPDTSAKTPDVLSVDFADGTSADHAQHTVTTAPDTSATPGILNVDFADGTPAEHAQNLPETTYGVPSIANDPTAGKNVATFNGTTDAYTYPFSAEWPKVANGFSVECKFRWNGAVPTTGDHGVCSDTNGGGVGVHVLNGEPMTYAFIGGAYKTIYDPTPVVPGTWYDVITTWDGNYLDEYVNGKLVATQYATGALGLPSPANTSWHWTIGADASAGGIEQISSVSVATSKIWDKGLPAGPKVAIPDTLTATTYGTPSIAKDAGLRQNVATFNGTTDAYTYPFDDQWSKVAKGFTIECKFRWNDPAGPTTADHGVCSDTNSGGIGVHVVSGEPMTYAFIGGAYKEIFDPNPVVPGTWYDVVTTWDGSTLDEYVNGTLVASQAASGAMGLPQPNATAYHFAIGADASAGGIESISPVSIATSKIWSTALPSAGTTPVYDIGHQTNTINVGLQPAGMTVHKGAVFVANTNADTVSIIDAVSHKVTQTFAVQPLHGATVGAGPNSITFADDSHLLVSVGRDNAIAVFNYTDERQPVAYKGLIPTDWYPNQVSYDAKVGKVIVSNQQGIGTNGYQQTYKYQGTLTSFSMPADKDLDTTTKTVFHDNAWDVAKPTGSGNAPRQHPAIPVQLGQPSAIKHVFLIIKENRTYDQILGDIGKGNSSTTYLNYGAAVTPNQHSLANSFTLFDNFYDSGMLSADGHQWLVQGNNNDYQAQNAASVWARSYPYPGGDALSYQQSGFIWNTVQAAGGTVRNYGEFEAATTGKQGTWQQYYADSQIMEGKAQGTLPIAQNSAQWVSDVPDLNTISNHDYPHFDPSIPDQYRTDIWEQDFKKAEQTGVLPSLTTMELGVDHTGGAPTGTAQVADNDLAVGRIISDISHSQFWKDSAVFVLEDDTQAGNDHVDGHRGPLFIASPYANRDVVNSEYYSQVNVVKTIEQILGAQPMNQMDQAAIPMYDAFTNTPDLTPYNVLPNQIPLTQGVTGLIPLTPTSSTAANPSAAAAVKVTNGPAAPAVPAAEQAVASQWTTWYRTEATPKLTGANAAPDATNPPQLNRYDWYTATNWSKPYPGDAKILAPNQVPGRNLPSNLLGD